MTSNQVANAANIENARHNLVSENLMRDSNDITREKNLLDNDYKRNSLRIQEEYNRNYLALQKAQGDEKLRLQSEANWIEWKKSINDEAYKTNSIRIQEEQNRLESKRIDETERYQKALNDIGMLSIDVQESKNMIEKMRAENENKLNLIRAQNEYSIGLIREENVAVRNELQKELQEWQEATMFTDSVWKGVGTMLRGFLGK